MKIQIEAFKIEAQVKISKLEKEVKTIFDKIQEKHTLFKKIEKIHIESNRT
jgi:hypothetical protein